VLHGDLHGGNIKVNGDNSKLVVFDWAYPIELDMEKLKHFGKYLVALVRKDPGKIARELCGLLDPDYESVTVEEMEKVVTESLAAEERRNVSRRGDAAGWKRIGVSKIRDALLKKMLEIDELQNTIMLVLGLHHQAVLDSDVLQLMRTVIAVRGVLRDELAKPEYEGKMRKHLVIATSLIKVMARELMHRLDKMVGKNKG
jgi:predicted unusual protein kinase regulating ubiquinone biosynthesis (AarF/ABC1/UbiB family)